MNLENVPNERSQTEGRTVHDATSMNCPEQANPWRQKGGQWLPGVGEGDEKQLLMGTGPPSGVMKIFWHYTEVVVALICR